MAFAPFLPPRDQGRKVGSAPPLNWFSAQFGLGSNRAVFGVTWLVETARHQCFDPLLRSGSPQ